MFLNVNLEKNVTLKILLYALLHTHSHTLAPTYLLTKSLTYVILSPLVKHLCVSKRSRLGLSKKDLGANATVWSNDIDMTTT